MKKNKKYKLFRNKFALVGALGILLSGCGIENNNNIKMDNDSSLTTVSEETDYTDTSIEDITTIVQETTKKEAVESTTSHSTTIEEVEATTSTSDISQLQSVELINISFDGLDTQKTLDDIKDIEVKYYFKDVFNVSDYLNKYKNLKDYNSVHSLKYINNGKIDSTTLKSKIKSNNTSYMQNNNMTNYALLNSDDFDTIFDIIVDNLNRRLEDSIDYYDLDTKLDTLKILDYSRNVNGGYTPDDNVIGINMSAMNKLNKKDFLTFIKKPSFTIEKINPQAKRDFLGITGIKNKLRHSNSEYVDPETILERLKKATCVTSLTEKPFVIGNSKQITAGRKFNFVFQFNKGKKYDMIFEVHDFVKDGKKTWVMRIYDNDKIKDSRSYLTRIGNFIENAYLGNFTHIPCGPNGEKFVLGN